MSDKRYIIAIDSGTQSIRAVLFDSQGNELAIEQKVFEPYFSLQPGWAEQSTDDYWGKLCTVTKSLMAKITIDKAQIAGVGITTQRGTVIPMDSSSRAISSPMPRAAPVTIAMSDAAPVSRRPAASTSGSGETARATS